MRPSVSFIIRPDFPVRSFCRACVAMGVVALTFSVGAAAQSERPASVDSAQSSASASATAATSGASIGGLTDVPIAPGQMVHVSVFNAPDFAVNTRVSDTGDIAYPYLGAVHVEGLSSAQASQQIAEQLKSQNLVVDPRVMVTVDTFTTGVTVMGEVHAPGIYSLPGKQVLSDVIATAGGMTANTGRVIEISSSKHPEAKHEVPWDPTMHNTKSYDEPVQPGDRVLVRSCGFAYIGGHVTKPGAYSLCGSREITLSGLVAMAGATTAYTSERHVYLVRQMPDGTRAAQEVDLTKVLRAKAHDPVIHEDDIIFVTPSAIKDAVNRAVSFALTMTTTLFYVYGK